MRSNEPDFNDLIFKIDFNNKTVFITNNFKPRPLVAQNFRSREVS
nr:hypothetical protein [Dyadobacter chenhuakuii]